MMWGDALAYDAQASKMWGDAYDASYYVASMAWGDTLPYDAKASIMWCLW